MNGNPSEDPATQPKAITTKAGCLWLMLAGLGFIVLMYGSFIFFLTRPSTAENEANELNAIERCWENAGSETRTLPGRQFANDSCKEMEKQFKIKFGHEP
ncbi:hypothetical protein [Azomonas macrocytogenes]|uniref:Uncharacterized protein n=1 Tax=Azomonas macrocytogenes TaxID=69962 RepID=A0A839SYG7_AZOMA|nr:hypothetical protein [Azomonas macrocytogenes]MBB3101938.1 hypothetical protein [Azomonas macrocytogenes]